MTTLPREPGFYWWRTGDWYEWKLIRVRHRGTHLESDDVSEGAFTGRPLREWTEFAQLGEWVKSEEPK